MDFLIFLPFALNMAKQFTSRGVDDGNGSGWYISQNLYERLT